MNANPDDLTLIDIARRYSTEESARAYFESIRWPNGPVCPHCDNANTASIYNLTANATTDKNKRVRPGLYRCAACGQSFTVTVGTVMEDSHIPLTKWLLAFYIMAASKTQVSALQLQRQLELGSYRTALHMCHRIRFALSDVGLVTAKLTGTVEADETWIGGKHKGGGRGYVDNKVPVVSMVERDGIVRSTVVDHVNARTVGALLDEHVSTDAVLNTDESSVYTRHGKRFAGHDTVNHSEGEYVRHDRKTNRIATTNAAEGFFGNCKRSISGTHHRTGVHLPLYFAELDFKYNQRKVTDGKRAVAWIGRIGGRRLTYRKIDTTRHDEAGVTVAAMTPRKG